MQAGGPGEAPRFRVGPWLVEEDTCVLSRGDEKRHIRPLLLGLLRSLAERPGQVVAKDEILERVWPGSYVSESALTRAMAELRQLLEDPSDAPLMIETIPRRGYRLIAPVEGIGTAPEPRLAVLPFANLNHDPEQDYFAEGISDALITELGSIPGLRVISRQSVLRYKGSGKSLPEIAHELKVGVVVEGTALRAADRVRINAQLVQADPEQHLWARAYEGPIDDILALQGRVARAIAESVHAVLTPADLARLSRPRTAKPEAHLAYLKGRYHLGQWTRESIARGFEFLRQATVIDPDYAAPYAQLAEGLAVLGYWGHIPFKRAYADAKAAASRALEIDDGLGDAHAIFGFVCWLLDWDPERGEREMRRAVALSPSSQVAHLIYAKYLATMRSRPDECLHEAALGLELDPLSVNTNFSWAYALAFAGEYDRARAHAAGTLELFPDALHAWYVLGWAELGRGQHAASVAAFEKAAALSPDPISLAYLAHALGRSGQSRRARAVLEDLRARRETEDVAEFAYLLVYCGLGELDLAFDSLELCYAEHDSRLFWLQVVPCFAPLRGDARFAEFTRRLGLPPRLA